MIISKTPLRISFVGGGSDIITDLNKTGSVISSTIDKHIYVMLKKSYDDRIRISYSKNEVVNHVSLIKHKLIKKVFEYKKIFNGVELVTVSDIPASGSGLGSSSTLTVGLINAINCWKKNKNNRQKLALEAYHVEKKLLNQTIGYQDQSSASFGGFNEFKFEKNKIVCKKLNLDINFINYFFDHILIFHTGIARKSENILNKINSKKNSSNFSELSDLTKRFKKYLFKKDINELSLLIKENWIIKKKLNNNINNKIINEIYQIGINNGAKAGKLLGAGAGGHIMFISNPRNHKNICKKLYKLKKLNIKFEAKGSEIILK
jgi:D-glycero-alpha-D-manno-heptose-7-phosphate kinase